MRINFSKKILFVSHHNEIELGIMKNFFLENNYNIEVINPLIGKKLPKDFKNYSGIIILGGAMNVNDTKEYPDLINEIDWIKEITKSNIPILGICLGAQLIANAYGATVDNHKDGLVEIGYRKVSFINKNANLDFYPNKVFQWHTQGFNLPNKSQLLAYNELFDVQAFVIKNNIFGFQFHPEVDKKMIIKWNNKSSIAMKKKGFIKKETQLKDHETYSENVSNWFKLFLKNWLISY